MDIDIRSVLKWHEANTDPSKVKAVSVSLIELRELVAELDRYRDHRAVESLVSPPQTGATK